MSGVVFSLAAMWIASGVSKLIAPAEFVRIVEHHGLVGPGVARVSWLVGAAELVLGLGLIGLGGRSVARVLAWALGAVLLVSFAWYVRAIPEDAFAKVGCGCQIGLKADATARDRLWIVRLDLALAAVHGLLAIVAAGPLRDGATR